MTTPPAPSYGRVVNLRPSGDHSESKSSNLFKTDRMEVVRLILPAGKKLPSHTAPGEMTVQCLVGGVDFTVGEVVHPLKEGQLLHLTAHEAHAVVSREDAILLLTIVRSEATPEEKVQEASEESFPASDAPAWTGVNATQR